MNRAALPVALTPHEGAASPDRCERPRLARPTHAACRRTWKRHLAWCLTPQSIVEDRDLTRNPAKGVGGLNRLGQVLQNPHTWVPWPDLLSGLFRLWDVGINGGTSPLSRAGKSHRCLLTSSWLIRGFPSLRSGGRRKSHRRLLVKGHRPRACKGLRKGGRTSYAFFDSVQGAWESRTVKGLGRQCGSRRSEVEPAAGPTGQVLHFCSGNRIRPFQGSNRVREDETAPTI
jgi:hypothetical protein